MYRIRRINVTDVFLLCRCYGSHRNQPNHYETLCVQSNSSQKEIRDAFLKLSKELHPDIANKGNHAKFVKINEAYNILSKNHTRKQYDIDLKYQSVSAQNGQAYRHSEEGFYHGPGSSKSEMNETEANSERNYYGIKGIKRVRNGTIAMICVAVCLLIISLEMMAFRRAVVKSRYHMEKRSLEAEQHYAEARAMAHSMSREEQIEALQKKFDAQSAQYNFQENDR